jgi:hypothetical protein
MLGIYNICGGYYVGILMKKYIDALRCLALRTSKKINGSSKNPELFRNQR